LPDQVVAPLVKSSNAPIYGIAVSYLGKGIVGGSLLDQEGMGREAADLALRILRGERVGDIPVSEPKWLVAIFICHHLRRSRSPLVVAAAVKASSPRVRLCGSGNLAPGTNTGRAYCPRCWWSPCNWLSSSISSRNAGDGSGRRPS